MMRNPPEQECRASRASSQSSYLLSRSLAQSNAGELRLKVTDPHGLGVRSTVELASEANQYNNTFVTDDNGVLIAKRLPFGLYRIQIQQPGFAEVSMPIEVRSAIPVEYAIKLSAGFCRNLSLVQDVNTLIDPYRAGSANEIGSETIQTRATSLPGRSLQDLVNSQPGWLYEGNAVLHPRGSEYQTQFVVDGIPLTDNRSPSFGPEIEADDVDSLNIYTAGIPAEFGRKMGGVIEVNTLKDTQPGLHGQTVLSGGSFDTAGAFAQVQYVWKGNTLGGSARGEHDQPLPESCGSAELHATTEPPAISRSTTSATSPARPPGIDRPPWHHALSDSERAGAAGRWPAPGRRQLRDHGHRFLPARLFVERVGQRARHGARQLRRSDFESQFDSGHCFLHNDFKEGYFNGSISVHHGPSRVEGGSRVRRLIPAREFQRQHHRSQRNSQRARPQTFAFTGSRPDLEQSAYVQDLIRLGNWTVSAGLRWDHYQLLVNQNAVSPRLSVARFFPSAGLVIHASYDRVFQTPSSENILLSSSAQVVSLSPDVLRLPVEPSHGNYYEVGATKSFPRQIAFRCQLFPPLRKQLRRRRPDSEHRGQLSDCVRQGRDLRSGREDRDSEVGTVLRLRQLLLHRWQCLVAGHWRAVLGRRRGGCQPLS